MGTRLCVWVPDDVRQRMREVSERVNWSACAVQAFEQKLRALDGHEPHVVVHTVPKGAVVLLLDGADGERTHVVATENVSVKMNGPYGRFALAAQTALPK